jgi:hypothetical protein
VAVVHDAHLLEARLVEGVDLVHLQAARHVVGDEEHRRLALQLVHGLREVLRGLRIQAAGGLVEEQDARTLEDGAGDGEALLLAAGEADAVLADLGLVTLGQLVDNVVNLGDPGRLDDVVEAGTRIGGEQVLVDGAAEKIRFLGHDAEILPQLVGGEMTDIAAVDLDAAFFGLIEAEQQLGEGALARTRRTGQDGELAGLQAEIEVAAQPGAVGRVAEGKALYADFALALRRAGGREGHRLGRTVHDVAQALDGDIRLLELLPKRGEAQHGLAHAAGEHLKGDQHADGEAIVLHDQRRANDEDREGHGLLEGIGGHVVGAGDLPRGKPRREVAREHAVVAVLEARLHLQALHGLHAGDVLGEEGLVTRAKQELRVQAGAQQRCDQEADYRDHPQESQRDQRELPAVGEHHREEDEEEGEVQDQRYRRACHELADGLHGVHPGDQHAGRALLEVRQREAQQVAEDLAAQHRVHAVAGVQDQVLPQPAHARVEEHEHHQTQADRDQRALRLIDDHLVQDHLRSQGRGETDELDEERSQQHVAPDLFVLEELGGEPAEAEAPGSHLPGIRIGRLGALVPQQDELRLEAGGELAQRRDLRSLGASDEIEQPLAIALHEQRWPGRVALEHAHAGKAHVLQTARLGRVLACLEAKGAGGFDELRTRVRRREALLKEFRIEGNAADLAKAADQPEKIARGYACRVHRARLLRRAPLFLSDD